MSGITKGRESTMSKIPPIPGRELLSFCLASLLSSDSTRSLICPKAPIAIPSKIAAFVERRGV